MYYYKAIFQYNGTQYKGFQFQEDGITVQAEINKTLLTLLNGHVTTKGSSRTDTGVHALKQMVKITSSNPINSPLFLSQFNQTLPSDIICLSLDHSNPSFQPNQDNIKEYRYFFTNDQRPSATTCPFIVNFSPKLDFELITECIEIINGEHDFCNFYSCGSNVTSTIRTVFLAELKQINPQELFQSFTLFQVSRNIQTCFEFKIQGNGFLKQMNRHLISALWKVGTKKMSVQDFTQLLDGPKVNRQLWKVARPNGLFLWDVRKKYF